MKKEEVKAAIYAQRSYTNAEIAQYYQIGLEELNQAIADYNAGKFKEVEVEAAPEPKPRAKKKAG